MTKYEIEKRLQSKQQVEKSRQSSPPQTSSTSTSANGVEDGATRDDDGEGDNAPVRKEGARQDDKAAATEGKEENDTHDAEPEKRSNGDAMEE